MKAVRINEPKNVVLADIEKPTPKAGEALIRIITAGICGSDIGAFRGTNNLVSYPRIIGHELAGIIESIPEDNPKGLKIGDKVIADPYLYCGHAIHAASDVQTAVPIFMYSVSMLTAAWQNTSVTRQTCS